MLGAYSTSLLAPSQYPSKSRMGGRGSMLSRGNLRMILGTVSIIFVVSILLDWLSPSYLPRTHQQSEVDSYSDQEIPEAQDHIEEIVTGPTSRIGKLSMLYGNPGELYDRAIAAHLPHNQRFGYPFHVLREKTLPAYWSKPAYILQHLLTELAKPESDRLEWLVWFDADTVLMNPKIPLEIFLPPSDDWSHIHCVVTNDHRGLNNGVFFLRVHEWSVWLMNACLGTETFDPDVNLEFGDQSALMYWLNQESFRRNTIHVPQRWFNAYAGYRGEDTDLFADPTKPQTKFRPNSVKEGDLLVHHAGHKSLRAQRMAPWMDLAEQHVPNWELDLEQTTYLREIENFWTKDAKDERKNQDKLNKKLAEINKKKEADKAAKLDREASIPANENMRLARRKR